MYISYKAFYQPVWYTLLVCFVLTVVTAALSLRYTHPAFSTALAVSALLTGAAALLNLYFLFHILRGMIQGAPFVPTPLQDVKKILQIADVSARDHVLDIGSGDGRFLY